jgi:drug/metabolite transporter (DMT)-like permease
MGVYTWLLRSGARHAGRAFLTLQIALGGLMILPFALLEYRITGATAADRRQPAALLYVALLPSLVAYFCWDRGVARAGAVLLMYFVNLTPVFAGYCPSSSSAKPSVCITWSVDC